MKKSTDKDQVPTFAPDLFIIPARIMLDPELRPLDSKVYGVVYWLERLKDGRCWASNETIANIINASASAVSHSISRLFDKHYIIVTLDEKNHRKSIVCTVNMGSHYTPSSNELPPLAQMSYIDNNIKSKEYSSETLVEMKKIHGAYVRLFKIKSDVWNNTSTDERQTLLLNAIARYKLTPARKAKIAARLNDAGFEMIIRALKNANKNAWNHGENDSGWKMDLYDYLLRNYEMVEKWADKGGVE